MTVHALLVDPPRDGLVLSALAETSPLSEREVTDLYAAMVADAALAVEASGGDLLVNYRPNDLLPEAFRGDDVEAELRSLVGDAVDDPEEVRYEVQVGSTTDARVGNTVTHLLREEETNTVAVLDGTAPTLSRTDLDGAAMKLRRNEVVIGPAPGGRTCYLGLSAPIDFDGASAVPELETVANRARDAGHGVDFLSMHPSIETGDDLLSLLAVVRARRSADRPVPERTASLLDEFDLRIDEDGGRPTLDRT